MHPRHKIEGKKSLLYDATLWEPDEHFSAGAAEKAVLRHVQDCHATPAHSFSNAGKYGLRSGTFSFISERTECGHKAE